ncbi:hypothetical protein B0J12DRAFT_394911 [Macrophomina phaseolina]|uniref:dihydroneopterin aldolase n=1 Tax=Macrophomina phaseolina TaxID=35725 RepID=A0ABQ8FUV5_9PEZI|nr:hypothetical protein B0J12DRAFT_394911 [Macrophomina phaseolina]
MASPGRIPRATDPDSARSLRLYAHEAVARWPHTADTVSISSLNLTARAGRDVWGRTDRSQPLSISVTVASRAGFATAAAGDALDGGTVHYGHLSKNILAGLEDATAGGGKTWLSGLDVASRVSEAVVGTAAAGAVEAARVDVRFPKASTLGSGAGVEWALFYAPARGDVLASSRALYVRDIKVPTLIGVNSNERMKKQMCSFSVWIDSISDAAVDGYDVVEDMVLQAAQYTGYETLEALAEKVAWVLFKDYIAGQSPGSNLRIRIEKPTAVPFADAPAIEIYRTQAQVLDAST